MINEMKKLPYILSFISVSLLIGCAKDDTTFGGNPISEISIDENSVLDNYELEKNAVLEITPKISQSIEGKTLNYEWEVEHTIVSTEPVFSYTCNELGSFDCRLIVSNEDGKAFKAFTINVNTPYEEGIVIISKDSNGRSYLSFMLHNIDGTEDKFYDDEIFSTNNPEISFTPNVSDAVVSNGNLILSCLGDQTTPPCIYYLNEKTMDLENYVSVPEYEGFAPKKLLVCSVAFAGASYPVVSYDGKIYEFASTEGTVVQSNKFPSDYDIDTAVFYDNGSGTNYNIFLWDEQVDILSTMFNGYGGYYCVKEYDQKSDPAFINNSSNIFGAGKDKPLAMFIPQFTTRELLREAPLLYIITESNGRLRRTVLNRSVWVYSSDTGKNIFDLRETMTDIGAIDDCKLEKGAPMIASNTNKSLFFSKGNIIYRWNYQQGNITAATEFITLGGPSTIITGLALSTDQSTLYVVSYDTAKTGKNGSCHMVEISKTASTEEVYAGDVKNYENIGYQPVKILYKQK